MALVLVALVAIDVGRALVVSERGASGANVGRAGVDGLIYIMSFIHVFSFLLVGLQRSRPIRPHFHRLAQLNCRAAHAARTSLTAGPSTFFWGQWTREALGLGMIDELMYLYIHIYICPQPETPNNA